MTEDKHTRYHQRQRERGFKQCTVWIPVGYDDKLKVEAHKLRARHLLLGAMSGDSLVNLTWERFSRERVNLKQEEKGDV